jgi:TetR/AcrR family transcriptional regulator, mexJK operon transcriptional repressor
LLDPPDPSRSARKRRAILAAAERLFFEHGYLGTSMDEIAQLAVVSKQTVYRHFADKERLFIEIVTRTVDEISDPVAQEVLGLRESERVQDDLRALARTLLGRVMQPRLLALRRLVIAESGRFPELGRAFYERGPGRTIAALATVFERLAAGGALSIDDPLVAAGHFNWLIMAAPINQAMLLGPLERPAGLETTAARGVDAFMAAYGPR